MQGTRYRWAARAWCSVWLCAAWVPVQPRWRHVYFRVCSAVSSPENWGMGWKAEVAGTDEQEKGGRPISTAQGGPRPHVFSCSVDLFVPTTCSVTCQAPPTCPQASVEPEQVGGCGPLAIGGRGEPRRRPSWALWGAAQSSSLVLLPLCGTGSWASLGLGPELPKPLLLSAFLHLFGFLGPLSSCWAHVSNCATL